MPLKSKLLLLLIFIFNYTSFAQNSRNVSGVVRDSTGENIIAATVKLIIDKDTLFTHTDIDGGFTFKAVKSSGFLISIFSLGYQTLNKRYLYNDDVTSIKLDPVILKSQSRLLNEVLISGTPAITIKEDTVEYRASDYKLRENALTEDLLKKLPGIEVDKDGNVKAQGKNIGKIRVNGKDFFGGDVKSSIKQLPANIIGKIQIVDDYGDQANLTGIKNGDSGKVLNIQISPDKNKGYFGTATVGLGNKERYQASLTANAYNNTRQLSFFASMDNTNNRGGLTNMGSIGFNYHDDWSKKLRSYGSYSFSNRNNDVISHAIQQSNFLDTRIFRDQNSNDNTRANNQRLNWNMEYRPDSSSYIKFSPSVSYSTNKLNRIASYIQNSNSQLSSKGTTLYTMSSQSPAIDANVLLNRRFAKRGRNISLNLFLTNSKTSQDKDALNEYTASNNTGFYQHQKLNIANRSINIETTLSYTEPLSKTASLEFNYDYNYTKHKNERNTYDLNRQSAPVQNRALSNDYNYSFTTNSISVNYRDNQKRYNYSLGASVQPTVLHGSSVISGVIIPYHNRSFNFIPIARFAYNFSKTRSFNISYFGRSNDPDYSQLQPVPDVSNPQYPVYGNPALNAEFNHTISLGYNNFEVNTGNSLFTNISASFTQNKIVSNLVRSTDPQIGLIQETRYLNTADGYYTLSAYCAYSKPLAERKYVFSLTGYVNYNNNISFIDDLKNTGRNWILSPGLNAQINPVKWLEINSGANYRYNLNSNDLVINSNARVSSSSWDLNFNSKTYFLKIWLIGTEISQTFNTAYSSSLAAGPLIFNAWLEKQFFKNKNGALRFQAYNLFNESASVSRYVTANSIIDVRNSNFPRYFMLSFILRLQKFSGRQPSMQMPSSTGDMD